MQLLTCVLGRREETQILDVHLKKSAHFRTRRKLRMSSIPVTSKRKRKSTGKTGSPRAPGQVPTGVAGGMSTSDRVRPSVTAPDLSLPLAQTTHHYTADHTPTTTGFYTVTSYTNPLGNFSRKFDGYVNNKKLSYPQRECTSNVTLLYGADGISI